MNNYIKYLLGGAALITIAVGGVASYTFFSYQQAYNNKDFPTMYKKLNLIHYALPNFKPTGYEAVLSEILYKYGKEIESTNTLNVNNKLFEEWDKRIEELNLKRPMSDKKIENLYKFFKTIKRSRGKLEPGIPKTPSKKKFVLNSEYRAAKKSIALLSSINTQESNRVLALCRAHIIKQHIYELVEFSKNNTTMLEIGREYSYKGDTEEVREKLKKIEEKEEKEHLEYINSKFKKFYNGLKVELEEIKKYAQNEQYENIYLLYTYTSIYDSIDKNDKLISKFSLLKTSEKKSIQEMNVKLYELTRNQRIEYSVLDASSKESVIKLEKDIKNIIMSYK